MASDKKLLMVKPVQERDTLYLRNMKKENCEFIREQAKLAGEGKTLAEVVDEIVEFFKSQHGKGAA